MRQVPIHARACGALHATLLACTCALASPQDAVQSPPAEPLRPSQLPAPEWADAVATLARTRTADACAAAALQPQVDQALKAIQSGLARHSLPHTPWATRAAIEDPWRAIPVAASMTGPLCSPQMLARRPFAAAARATARSVDALDPNVPLPAPAAAPASGANAVAAGGEPPPDPHMPRQGAIPVQSASAGVFAMRFLLEEPALMMSQALAPVSARGGSDLPALAAQLVRAPGHICRVKWNVGRTPPAEERPIVDALVAAAAIDVMTLAAAIDHCDADLYLTVDWTAAEPEAVPQDLLGAVTGVVHQAEHIDGLGWVVVGSLGDNAYDMSRIAAVLDPGGDDTYRWGDVRTGMQGIIDLAGNDHYYGTQLQGPAAGVLGISFIDDRAGNDLYEAPMLGAGAAIAGAGILIDRGGNDTYRVGRWGCGAAIGGAGFLIDVAGNDDYQGSLLVQGVGGPSGIGALVDADGDDRFSALGDEPSVYGMPATQASLSQGIGFGFRPLLAGGTGMLIDLRGNDRYIAGEFAQGGGYFLGIGIARDLSGRDSWVGDRYSQAWSAHQAVGVLIEDAGDDLYLGRTAASQAGAWDQSVSALIDRRGNDTYRADGLSQGAAAQQAFAALIDAGGADTLEAAAPMCQGGSGPNDYHFEGTKARSLSWMLLLDGFGGAEPRHAESTRCSAGRIAPGVTITGAAPLSVEDAVAAKVPERIAEQPAGALLLGASIIDASPAPPKAPR